jgi:hypothetical protein
LSLLAAVFLTATHMPDLCSHASVLGRVRDLQPIDKKDVNRNSGVRASGVLEPWSRGTKMRENSYRNLPMPFLPWVAKPSRVHFILNSFITLQNTDGSTAVAGLREDAATVNRNPSARYYPSTQSEKPSENLMAQRLIRPIVDSAGGGVVCITYNRPVGHLERFCCGGFLGNRLHCTRMRCPLVLIGLNYP